ncbi:hypothetical protein BJV78DRAFT_1153232 [Lactifluus subvellereus]|nr:hypothetical protein BJV78DRAFT_1153232 [Lactifluus subvellereus]
MHPAERLVSHLGKAQAANLGDRNDVMFRRDGPNANSGALFLAVSEEDWTCSPSPNWPSTQNVCDGYTIPPNSYNLGRDSFEEGAPGLKYRGVNLKYKTTVQSISGMIPPISTGINRPEWTQPRLTRSIIH